MPTAKKVPKPQPPITLTLLAKDILKYLQPDSKVKLKPRRKFAYCLTPKGNAEPDLQKVLQAGKVCEVCGIGAFLAAKAYRIDGVEFRDTLDFFSRHAGRRGLGSSEFDQRVVRNSLQAVADPETLLRIEKAFEKGTGVPREIKSARGRLEWICKNIIRNKGVFKPLIEATA